MFLASSHSRSTTSSPKRFRPEVDKQKKITIAEGQLLGKHCCHRGADGKTNANVAKIAKAKRQYDNKHGLAKPAGKLSGPAFPKSPKSEREAKALPPRRSLFKEMQGQSR